MNINQGVNLTLSQKQQLKMTPELRQAIQILQYSTLELGQFIREQLLVNPMLAQNESQPDQDDQEVDWEELADLPNSRTGSALNFDETVDYASLVAGEISLQEHLLKQLHFLDVNESEHALLLYLIRSVNEDGYLEIDEERLLEKFGIPGELLELMVQILQTFDPAGVGARSLEECLRIQSEHAGVHDEILIHLIEEFLEDIGKNRLRQIAKSLSLSMEQLEIYLERIRGLEPRPGRAFYSNKSTKYIKPDLFVSEVNHQFQLTTNDSGLPKLFINEFYRNMLKGGEAAQETSDYIRTNLNAAVGLVRSIEQRKNTIVTMAQAILSYQEAFFREGPVALKPLTMKEIAEETELHESTISRASNGKYLQCKWGVFELKYFFSSGLASNAGQDVSSVGTKVLIRRLVDKEDKKRPLSDQKIADVLALEGVQISRRTVAKYRGELQLPSTSERKHF
jgi:RNA polymerase sigma-54 factor